MEGKTSITPSSASSPLDVFRNSLSGLLLRIAALSVIDALAIWFVIGLAREGDWILLGFVAFVTVGVNAAFLIDGLYPFRWFAPGLALMIIMILYPTLFTVYVSITNYRDGNLLTPPQAERIFDQQLYLPEDSPTYSWKAFRSESDPNDYALWLTPDSDRATEVIFATDGEVIPATELDLGGAALDEDGIPESLPGYVRVPQNEIFRILDNPLSQIEFGEPDNVIKLSPTRPDRQAGVFRDRYTFNEDETLFDHQTQVTYEAIEGTYTPIDAPLKDENGVPVDEEGQPLEVIRPGYFVITGTDNFQRLIESEKVREPFVRVFLWTITHAFLAVFITFWFGLGLAVVLNADFMPGRAFLRTALLIPYAVPGFISVLVWRGLLNEQVGIVNKMLEDIGINGPPWRSDPLWAKMGILIIQLWLGFPYMMLVCTGALQSIPRDIYQAARVDGANYYQQFRFLTLPLLLVAVGPLLIASFAFNFNNFTVIQLYAEGGPPISPESPAGHTDILITYTYDLAFGSGRGADYAFAATITLVIFMLVAALTIFNFRFTRSWEETSENV
jgi:arabinogalactan oligomer / maltooligosaccharide transport system permease protein